MSDDIVERLCACTRLGDGWWKIDQHLLMSDAIDEIVRLRAENERLVALLDERVPSWRTYR